MQEISISDVVDLNGSFKQIDQLISYIDKIDKKIQEINEKQIKISGVDSLRELRAISQDLQKITRDLTDTVAKSGKATEEETKKRRDSEAATRRQLSAYEQLKKQYKEAIDNARNLAVQYGAESEQAIEAAKAADLLKAKLEAANSVVKKPSQKPGVPTEQVPFTHNLSELEKEKELLSQNREVVNDLEKAEAQAANSATAMGAAVSETSKEVTGATNAFVEIKGAFDEFTGSIQQNIVAQIENEQALAANRAQQAAIEKDIKAAGVATDGQNQKLAQLRQEELLIIEANRELSLTIKNQIRDFTAADGSIDEMRARLNLLQRSYESLTAEEKRSSSGQFLKQQIDQLDPALKKAEGEVGKFQRNVGNYSSAIGKGFQSAFGYLRQIAYFLPGIGIAGILGAVSDAVINLATSIFKSNKEVDLGKNITKEYIEEQKNLLQVVRDLTEAVVSYNAVQGKTNSTASTILRGQLSLLEAAGLNAEKTFALKARIAQLDAQDSERVNTTNTDFATREQEAYRNNLRAQIQDLERKNVGFAKSPQRSAQIEALQKELDLNSQVITKENAVDLSRQYHKNNYIKYNNEVIEAEKKLSEAIAKGAKSEDLSKAREYIDNIKNRRDNEKAVYDSLTQGQEQFYQKTSALDAIRTQEAAFNADQRRKYAVESQRIILQETETYNKSILSDDRSTLQERLAAIDAITEQQEKLIEVQNNSDQHNPGLSTLEKAAAQKKADAEIYKLTVDSEDRKFALREQYRLKDLQAEAEMFKQQKQLQAEAYKDLAGNDEFLLESRLQFQQNYIASQRAIIDEEYRQKKESVKNVYLTDQEKLQIETDYETKVLKLGIEAQKGLTEIIKSEINKQQQLREEDLDKIKQVYGNLDLKVSVDYSEEVVALNEALKQKLISHETYNNRRLQLDRKYNKETLQLQIDELEASLKNYDGAEAAFEAKEMHLQNLRQKFAKVNEDSDREIEDLEAKKRNATTDGARAMYDTLIQLAKDRTNAERKELLKQIDIAEADIKVAKINYEAKKKMLEDLAKLRKQLTDQGTSNDDDDDEKLRKKLLDILDSANDLAQAASTIGDGAFDKRMSQIQDEMTALDERYQHEKDLIEQTSQNDLEKKQRLAEADAKYAGQRKALEQQEKQERIRKAEFDKKAAVFAIVINTARAVVEALPNIPKAVTAGVLGAAQLAVAVSAPIPRFFKGKNLSKTQTSDDYEGPAWVDDGGRPELIIREDGRMEVGTNQPRITYLKKNDIVLPDARIAQETLIQRSMLNSQKALQDYRYIVVPNNNDAQAVQEQTGILRKELRYLREDVRATGKMSKKTNWFNYWDAQDILRKLNGGN